MRNPYDVIPSFAHLMQTLSHNASTGIDYAKNYTEWWHKWVKVVTKKIKWFFATLLDEFVKDKSNPLYIVRYEDLIMNKKETLMGLLSFILG